MISQNFLYAETKADLYGTLLPDGWFCFLLGESARLDTPARLYIYNGSSSVTDDGENVIKPTVVSGSGRWIKFIYQQLQTDWSQSNSGSMDFLKNKPSLSAVALSGSYSDLSAKPTLATVAGTGAYSDLTGKPIIPTLQAYEGTTLRTGAFPIFKSATVASGVAVFNLTADGTAGGTALFPNGVIADSYNLIVNDATASYQMSSVFTNSNKTVTVTANKLTTASILTGILGQAAANGAVIKLQIWGY